VHACAGIRASRTWARPRPTGARTCIHVHADAGAVRGKATRPRAIWHNLSVTLASERQVGSPRMEEQYVLVFLGTDAGFLLLPFQR
jgi:hypothetical protein